MSQNTVRTLIPPRGRDAWSFSGRGRSLYQYQHRNPRTGLPEPEAPPQEGAPVAPGEPRG